MASTSALLRIVVDMDTKGASAGASRLSKGVSKMTGPAVAAGAAVIGLAVSSGKAASRLQQSQGAVESVFGKSADKIQKWADAADSSVGLSEAAYGEMASVIGAQLKNIGVPMDQVADKTNDLIGMGADLSATYGGTTAEAVEALGSALRGETDPIERYGIAIKQATIEAKVGKDKLKKMTDAEKQAAKTSALLGLVTEQAGGAVGAFGREADTAAGQQQRATSAWEDASAHLGQVLLPVMAKVAEAFAAAFTWVDKHRTVALLLVSVIGALAGAILALNVAIKLYNMYTVIAGAVSKAAWISALGPIALVIAAIFAIGAVLVLMYKKVGWFKRGVDAAWRGIKTAAAAVWKAIGAAIKFVLNLAMGYIRAYGKVLAFIFRAGVAIVRGVWNTISDIVSTTIRIVKNVVRTVLDTVRTVMDSIKTKWSNVWNSLSGVVESVMRAAKTPIGWIEDAIDNVITAVSNLIGWIKRIKFPSPPKWLDKIIPGGSSVAGAVAGSAASVGGRVAAVRTTSSGGGGPQIVIQGALDPVAVAAQIRRILRADDRRRGVTVIGGGA